jgi:hypothetical protein
VKGRLGEKNHRESSFEAEQQEKTHTTPEWFKGHCVGFESGPESIAFAESAKRVREFVHQRSSSHVATEATGVAGELERRNLHRIRATLPSPSLLVK